MTALTARLASIPIYAAGYLSRCFIVVAFNILFLAARPSRWPCVLRRPPAMGLWGLIGL